MLVLTTDQEATTARQVVAHYQAQLTSRQPFEQESAQNMIAQIQRQLDLWDAGIREPVPGEPDPIRSPMTADQYAALSEVEQAAFERQAGILLKQAEIANIDRQIGIALDRIADWRRHRAWLEGEISELTAAADRQPAASRT